MSHSERHGSGQASQPDRSDRPDLDVQDGFRALVELSPDAVFVIVDGYHLFANARGIALLGGATIDDLRRQPAIDFMHPGHRDVSRARMRVMTEELQSLQYVEERIVSLDGRVVDIEAAGTPIVVGGRPGALVVVRDITARKQAEAALRAAELRFQAAFRHAPTGMAIVDAWGRVVEANPALADLVDLAAEEMVGFDCWRLVEAVDVPAVRLAFRALTAGLTAVAAGEFRYRRPDGGTGWLHGSAAPLEGARAYVVHFLEVTDTKLAQLQLSHRATHDHLTGLPNRALVLDRLAGVLSDASPGACGIAVMFIDLDGFKEVNDAYGHAAGDEVLRSVAQRLRKAVGAGDTIGRVGGDEFVAVLTGADAAGRAARLAQRIRLAVGQPVTARGVVVRVDASIGIASGTAGSAEALLAEADEAMYRAKLARTHRVGVRPRRASDLGIDQVRDTA